ncbi:MAG: flagellar FlbD family protein [Candidatus Latescibacterota bacterium]|nr:flagellar FlbD family protein [Candidatus Latescibacterota bacterium]
MIKLTRLNQSEVVINAEMIEFVEETPDTLISLISGKKVLVTEPVDLIINSVIEYKNTCNQPLFSGTA